MSYTPSILFDFVSTSANVGKIVSSITDNNPTVPNKNVYYEIIGPANLIVRSADFNTPDGVLNTVTPTAAMPNVSVPLDSFGEWLEGSYTIKFYIELAAVPGTYEEETCQFVLDIKKQGNTACNIQGVINVSVNCHCATMHIVEETDYQGSTIISHELTITPPTLPGQPAPAPLTTTGYVYDLPFTHANVTYNFNIVTVYENYYCDNEVTVREDLLATYSQKIVCSRNLCRLLACLEDKIKALIAEANRLGGFDALPKHKRDEYFLLQAYFFLYNQYVECGDWQKADAYFDILQKMLNCDCGCTNGNTDTPVQVTPECGSGGGITSLVQGSPQVVIGNPSPGVYSIGLDPNYVLQSTRGVTGTAPVVVTFNSGTNNYVVSLDPAFIAAALAAGGLTSITTATPGFLDITTPSPGVVNIDFDPTPIYVAVAFTAWVLFTNAQASNAVGQIDFDNTPYPLRTQRNVTIFNELKIDGTFKYDGYNPNTPICMLLPNQLSLPAGVRTGMSIPAFDDTGAVVGAVRIYGNTTNSNLIFIHNSKYVQNTNVNVNGRFNLD